MKFLVDLANKMGQAHARFFSYLAERSKTSVWFTAALTLYALYELFEHIFIPTLAILWTTGQLN